MGPGSAWASPWGHQSQTIKIKHLKKAAQQLAAGARPMLAAEPCFLRYFRMSSLDISRQSTGLACSTGPAWPCPVLDTPARNGPGGWAQPNGGRPGILLDGPAWRQQYPCDPGNVENNFPRSTLRGDNNTRWPLGRRLCLATNYSIPKAPRVLLSPRRVHCGKLGSTLGGRLLGKLGSAYPGSNGHCCLQASSSNRMPGLPPLGQASWPSSATSSQSSCWLPSWPIAEKNIFG